MTTQILNLKVVLVVIFLVFFCDICLAGTVAEANLVAWWKLDDSGTTATDSAGTNNGTLYGGAWTTGIIGGALDFDGLDDYIDCGDIDEIDASTNFTVAAWINTNSISNSKLIARKGEDYPPCYFWVNDDYTIMFGFYREAGVYYTASTTETITPGQWYLVAGTYDGQAVRTYINGQEKAINTNATGTTNSTSDSFRIGSGYSAYPTAWFDGKIDDVRIYDRALSLEEIEELYQGVVKAYNPVPQNGQTGVDPNVILSWSPSIYADSHDVYLGTDFNDVNDANNSSPEFMGNFDVNSYDPCGLDTMTWYYWRVDEANDANSDLWKGDVWTFETARPEIELSATQLEFYAVEGGTNPDGQILGISNTGVGILNWQIIEDCNWLSAEPNSGNSTGQVNDVNVSVNISGLDANQHTCTLTISDPNASNNPQIVNVTLNVSDSDGLLYVPSEYQTIQAAINVALDGDVVIVEPGTYTGSGNKNLDFGGKAITVRSTDPYDWSVVESTIINCQNDGRGFYFHSGENSNSIVSGLTIKNGEINGVALNMDAYGGGILCENSSPLIYRCHIKNNSATNDEDAFLVYWLGCGGGIACVSSSHPTIKNCIIEYNLAQGVGGHVCWGDAYGGGAYCDNTSSVSMSNCIIKNNKARGSLGTTDTATTIPTDSYGGGLYCTTNSSIENCLFVNNKTYVIEGWDDWVGSVYGLSQGAGIYCGSNTTIDNCTFYGNDTNPTSEPVSGQGGGIYGPADVNNGIIWANIADEQIYGSATVNYSDVQDGYSGTGNINADPCFVTGPEGDYYLSQIAAGQDVNSPCVDAGSDTAANLGLNLFITRTDGEHDSGIVDMGYHYIDVNAPVFEVYPLILNFQAMQDETNPDSKSVTIRNLGIEPLNWTATPDANWLSIDPNSGICPSYNDSNMVTVDVNIAGLAAGTYDANIVISDPCDLDSPRMVSIQLEVISYNIADFDKSTIVDSIDFGILANQWHQVPGIPSADIAPPGGDGFVDYNDLALFCQNWLNGVLVDIPNLVSLWKFDEGSGNIAYDWAGDNDGTLTGDLCWVTGKIGNYALDFDGDDGVYLNGSSGHDSPLNIYNKDITISAWVKPYTGRTVVARAKSECITYRLYIGSSGTTAGINYYIGHHVNVTTDAILSPGNWYHIVGVFDRSHDIGRVYVDGVEQATGPIPSDPPSCDATTKIGCRNDATDLPFDGTIDDVSIYDRALTEHEVKLLYLMGN